MNKKIKNKLINLPIALLLLLGGILTFIITQQGIDDLFSTIIYIAFGILFVLSSITLVGSISKRSYLLTITTCSLYMLFFLGITTYILKTDKTGQGLVGLMFLVPQAAISLLAVLFSIFRLKNINHITSQSS
ncbi:MAG: hypothetical protein KJ887_00895 [Candidatus Omnitrophica bacterium]|nr:hypothetical protein [Candidatus Omnitrophota bacterium]MBU1048109.1 hypothetical protein [Candidatus Omnitrophota bacterium]MBU1630754.1 hypothetical protein [Candidatus Omnitrophota bacterium]MBU1767461.1 hypothetical protein [Candidatus Omnitrophota bacterium]MBU1889199.1 hypothetical protein [Candidatus Omnitrophota bacterium]